jgi:hypothetical protein
MKIEIVELINSTRKDKRFKITLNEDGKITTYNFGLKSGTTFIDHGDEAKKKAYLARHMGNKTEKKLISNLIPSPALFSAKLLWGQTTDIISNLIGLQKEFNLKKKV